MHLLTNNSVSVTSEGSYTGRGFAMDLVGALANALDRLGLLKADVDYYLIRASMVIVFFFFGYQKWFAVERLIPFVSNGPLTFWGAHQRSTCGPPSANCARSAMQGSPRKWFALNRSSGRHAEIAYYGGRHPHPLSGAWNDCWPEMLRFAEDWAAGFWTGAATASLMAVVATAVVVLVRAI